MQIALGGGPVELLFGDHVVTVLNLFADGEADRIPTKTKTLIDRLIPFCHRELAILARPLLVEIRACARLRPHLVGKHPILLHRPRANFLGTPAPQW